jgi:hypothetical protein
VGDSNCLTRTFVSGTGIFDWQRMRCVKKSMRSLTSELACAGVMLQDQTRYPQLNDRAPQVVRSIWIEMTQHVMEWNQLAGMETN